MTVVGAGVSSRRPMDRGRLAPQVKQIRSPGLTSAAQFGQVGVAIVSSSAASSPDGQESPQ
jgi:hypothetical protein